MQSDTVLVSSDVRGSERISIALLEREIDRLITCLGLVTLCDEQTPHTPYSLPSSHSMPLLLNILKPSSQP